jgi:hypothetical protein
MFLLVEALYTEGLVFLLFTSLLFLSRHHSFFLLALPFSLQPPSISSSHAYQEGCAQSNNGEEGWQHDGSQVGSVDV